MMGTVSLGVRMGFASLPVKPSFAAPRAAALRFCAVLQECGFNAESARRQAFGKPGKLAGSAARRKRNVFSAGRGLIKNLRS
jgi:hypothetical protein